MSRRILIVDDEVDVIEFQKAYLTRRKYDVAIARNKAEAISRIKDFLPEIIFCDIRLDTYTTGLEILEETKKNNPSITIYLVTGLIDKEVESKGLALGAKEILTKPLSNQNLEKKITEA